MAIEITDGNFSNLNKINGVKVVIES